MRRAVFPGTFDPITLGHESLAKRVALVFEELIVGVAAGVHKRSFFSLDERLQLTENVFSDIDNIHVRAFDCLLADFMHQQKCKTIVRGLRVISDFEFESQLADINKALDPELETVFFLPDRNFIYLSSTVVREVAMLGGEVNQFVSPIVGERLREKLSTSKGK